VKGPVSSVPRTGDGSEWEVVFELSQADPPIGALVFKAEHRRELGLPGLYA